MSGADVMRRRAGDGVPGGRVSRAPVLPGRYPNEPPIRLVRETLGMEAGTETLSSIAAREDFLATGDPALQEAADSGQLQAARLRGALRALGAPAVGDPGPRLHARTGSTGTSASRSRGAVHRACTGSRRSSSASSGSPTSSGRSCAPRRRRRCGSSSRPRSPTRRATSSSSTASTTRSGVLEGADDLAERLARVQSNLNPEFERALRRDARSRASTGSPPSPRTPRRWSRR